MLKHFFMRRNYLVQPRFQLSLAAKAMVFFVLYGGVVALVILYPMAELIDLLPVNSLTPEAKKHLLSLPTDNWPLIPLLALVAAIQVILLSHRVSGPSFRLQRAMREMVRGQYQQVLTLRKNDCLKEVADSLAFLGDTLHRRRQTFLEELGKLRTRLEQNRQHMRCGEVPTALQHDIEWMSRQITVLERIADGTDVLGVTEPAESGPSPTPVSAGETSAPWRRA